MKPIKGPNGPIRYERDVYGYPRVRVRDRLEGAYVHGYLHALDRFVQVQLLLMIARGRSMELLGDKPPARLIDRAIHTFNFTGDLEEQIQAIDKHTLSYFQAYCDGFNAGAVGRLRMWITRLLGAPPEKFTPESILLIYRLSSYFGLASLQHVGEAIISELISEGASERLFEMLLGDSARRCDLFKPGAYTIPDAARILAPPTINGSNAFAVSASHSTTGSALLMGEPHMEIGRFPPVVYAIHIDYDEGDYLQGAGPPGLPWLVTGRTPDLAWSYTYAHADNIDTVIEHCRDRTCERRDGWLPLKRRVDTVRIRGRRRPEEWVYFQNEYGTVLVDTEKEGRYPCLRWSGLDQCGKDCNVIVHMTHCTKVQEAVDLYRQVKAISLAVVLADSAGSIAYVQTGQVDQRPDNWTGVTPYPGWELSSGPPEPAPEWTRPVQIEPSQGFIVSANELRNGSDGKGWSTLPEPSYRYDRLTQILARHERSSPDEMIAASYDPVDLCAARLLPIWREFLPPSEETHQLCDWATKQSLQDRYSREHREWMGLFHALHHEVVRAVLESHLGPIRTERIIDHLGVGLVYQCHLDAVLALEKPHLLDQEELRDAISRAWPAALKRIHAGRWWAPVRARFQNIVTGGKLPPFLGFSSGTKDLPGGPTVPFQARITEFERQRIVFGPVYHFLIDMGKPGSLYNIAGGASEWRFGPGYGRGVDEWLNGSFIPFGMDHPDLNPNGNPIKRNSVEMESPSTPVGST